jgi:hypothetical protein
MFIINLRNSIRFAKRDNNLPTFNNQLHSERKQAGFIIKPYCTLIEVDEEKTTQIRTDYDGAITATLINNITKAETVLSVVEKEPYPDFSTWEFEHTFDTIGNFSIIVTGADSEQDSVEYESEPIDVETTHKNTLLIKAYQFANTEYVDYSTGIQHTFRVESRIPDAEDETDQDIYDDQNQQTKTYSATSFNGELTTDAIPEYLVRQLVLAQELFEFYVNDEKYTCKEFNSERFGHTTSKQVAAICVEYNVPGVNSDDSFTPIEIIIPEDMAQNTYPLNLAGVSGNQQLSIPANFMPEIMMFVLKTGTSAVVKVGTTVDGDEVQSPKTINTANPVYTVGKEYLKTLTQYESAFILYVTITGVGATVDVNTVISKYK